MSKEHILSQILLKKADSVSMPIDGVFELTPICNMACKMCYVRKSKEEVEQNGGLKTVAEWVKIAEEAKQKGLLFLLLTGGEIFTYPKFATLYEELSKMGFVISINTNGTILGENELKLLKKYPPRNINITLYGSSEETYEKLCGNGKVFTKVINTIQLLKKNNLNVKMNMSLTPLNIADLEEIYEFAEKNQIHVEAAAYMFPPLRRGKCDTFVRFSPEDTAKYTHQINLMKNSKKDMEEQRNLYEKILSQGRPTDDSFVRMNCRGGHSSFWITWDGKLTPCGMLNTPYAMPFVEGFEKAWNKVSKEVKQIYLSSKCACCENRRVCSVCVAKAMAETGTFDGTPEYLCKVTNTMNNIMLYNDW